MLQLQEAENWNKPAATTWAAEFLLREGERRECLGSWMNSNALNEAKKRRAKQVITCSFPCKKWLYRIGVRTSPECELCKRERLKEKRHSSGKIGDTLLEDVEGEAESTLERYEDMEIGKTLKQWEGTWTGRLCVESASERVEVRRLKQDERARVWQPESSMKESRWCRALCAAPKNWLRRA
jgi:hypothetical protein